jgi:hypothetical protein
MKNWKTLILIFMVLLALTSLGSAGEILYNGIELPDQWPPQKDKLTRDLMDVPYLDAPPAVIPIDVGRQLFVDDFLVEESTLNRTFHQPEIYKEPVIKPEEKRAGKCGTPASDPMQPVTQPAKTALTGSSPNSTSRPALI